RNTELGEYAVVIAPEAVVRTGCIKVEPCDLPTRADCAALRALVGSCACTRRVEHGEYAILIAHEPGKRASRVNVVSSDRPVRVDELGAVIRKGTLKWPGACARRIEHGKHAFTGANIAVGRIG